MVKSRETITYKINNTASEIQVADQIEMLQTELNKQKDLEKKLLKQLDSLKRAQVVANTGSWEFNLINEKMLWSENTFRIYGIKPYSVVPTLELFLSKLHHEDRHLIDENLNKIKLTLKPQKIEFRINYEKNKFKWIESIIIPTFKDDRLISLNGVDIDITERKKSEVELKNAISIAKSQEKFSKISAEISTDLIDVSLDNIDKKINSALSKTGKYSTADRVHICLFKDAYRLMDMVYEWCSPGVCSDLEDFQDIPVPHNSWWMKKMVKKEHILIHQVKNMPEAALREKADLLEQNITSLITVPVFKGDELLGYIELCSKSEKRHWDIFLIQIIRAITNSIANAITSVRNQKQLLLAKEKAEESDRLKSAFLANMSHEIRTPMNGILGFIDLLRNLELTAHEQNLYYLMVKKSSDRLLHTISNIIEISKIESGQTPVINKVENVNEIMHYLCATYQNEADEKGLDFNVLKDTKYNTVAIRTDKAKLEVILKNLINNAIKFTCEGKVEMGYEVIDNTITFVVADSGPGITKDRQDAIFDRFVQADLNLTSPHEGSGLGLSITRAYAEMLQGKLWVESEPGKGSKFYFALNHGSIVSVN